MAIKKCVNIHYEDDETGFYYEYEPVNNEVEIMESVPFRRCIRHRV